MALIKLEGGLHLFREDKRKEININPGKKVRQYLIELNVPIQEVEVIYVNGELKSLDYLAENDDTITVLPVITGG